MTSSIDNFFLFSINPINSLLSSTTELLINSIVGDFIISANILFYSNLEKIITSPIFNSYIFFYVDNYYSFYIFNNIALFLTSVQSSTCFKLHYYLFMFCNKFFKLNLFIFVILTIFIITNFENYLKQQKTLIGLAKLFILNSSEKEVGPVDDYFFFVILFLLTLTLFILSSVYLIIFQSNMFNWAIGSLLFLMFLILTIPVSLFYDLGVSFFVAVRGSAPTNSLLKELVFDITSSTTVFIRFIVQNIRFFFIFSGIFELLEWVISMNSTFFTITNIFDNNLFISYNNFSNMFYSKNFNYFFINSILIVFFYFYYILHLLFLLLVQITVYVGISIWLFFFLYSTKFLTKYEKYLIIKKN